MKAESTWKDHLRQWVEHCALKLCQEGSYEEAVPDALFSGKRERQKERERRRQKKESKVKAESTWKDREARM